MKQIDNFAKFIFLAIDADDDFTLAGLLEAGAAPDAKSRSFPIPLHQAILRGNAQIAELLVIYGATIDTECPVLAATPLFAASALGHAAIARTLIANGANPNNRDLLGNTPLMAAVRGAHWTIARALIAAGADVYAQNPQRITIFDINCQEMSRILKDDFQKPLTSLRAVRAGLASVDTSIERLEAQASMFLRKDRGSKVDAELPAPSISRMPRFI